MRSESPRAESLRQRRIVDDVDEIGPDALAEELLGKGAVFEKHVELDPMPERLVGERAGEVAVDDHLVSPGLDRAGLEQGVRLAGKNAELVIADLQELEPAGAAANDPIAGGGLSVGRIEQEKDASADHLLIPALRPVHEDRVGNRMVVADSAVHQLCIDRMCAVVQRLNPGEALLERTSGRVLHAGGAKALLSSCSGIDRRAAGADPRRAGQPGGHGPEIVGREIARRRLLDPRAVEYGEDRSLRGLALIDRLGLVVDGNGGGAITHDQDRGVRDLLFQVAHQLLQQRFEPGQGGVGNGGGAFGPGGLGRADAAAQRQAGGGQGAGAEERAPGPWKKRKRLLVEHRIHRGRPLPDPFMGRFVGRLEAGVRFTVRRAGRVARFTGREDRESAPAAPRMMRAATARGTSGPKPKTVR
jgi:hypothetical protein